MAKKRSAPAAASGKKKSKAAKAQKGSRKRLLTGLGLLPLVLIGAFLGAFFVDNQRTDGLVARNVSLAGLDLSGADEAEAAGAVSDLAARFSTIPIEVVADDSRIGTNAGALGLRFESDATLDALMAVGRSESAVLRPLEWAGRFFKQTDVPLAVDFDATVASSGLVEVAKAFEQPSTYPGISMDGDTIVGVEGTPGKTLDTGSLLMLLQDNVPTSPDGSITLDADVVDIPPVLTGASLDGYAAQLNALTDAPLFATAGTVTKGIEPAMQRRWLQIEAPSDPTAGPLTTLKDDQVSEDLIELFGQESTEVDLSQITIVDKKPILGGSTSMVCCATDSPRRILEAIIAEQSEVTLPLIESDEDQLAATGIVELVGEFTTYHPAGQDRNTNIDRMADIVRGTIVEPGETFSINDHVGRRTIEGGFVEAGVIYSGVLTKDVGGGVSQFATTIFNAAFFAGLDFVEYQAHSLYFERYPYGREATVSFPAPDLVIRNTMPTRLLIWTSHTSESITVEIYGTKYADVSESGAWTEPVGACTKAITERTRLFPDKDAIVDTVFALYQPQEGLNCSGLPTTPPPECLPTEEPFDSNETGFPDDCRPLPEGTILVQDDLPGGGFDRACTGGQQPADTDGDGIADTCATPITVAGEDPCAPQVGVDTDGNGFIDRCVDPEGA